MAKLIFDGLKLVMEAERMGASPEAAKRAEEIVRRMVYDAFDEGMSVEEIRAEFGRMTKELDAMDQRDKDLAGGVQHEREI